MNHRLPFHESWLLPMVILLTLVLGGCVPIQPAPHGTLPVRVDHEKWQRYQADSGYTIEYPLALYSLRAGQSVSINILFPGVRVVEPNDAFTYQDREQAVYKLSIAVSTNEQGLTFDEPEALLANNRFILLLTKNINILLTNY